MTSIDLSAAFADQPCGWCPNSSGKSTYYYCRTCGGTAEGCATCTCGPRRQSEPRLMPCRVCGGRGRVPGPLSRPLDEAYSGEIREAKAAGLTAAEGRAKAFNGPLAAWHSVTTDGWEAILAALCRGNAVIVELPDGKLVAVHLSTWTGCFD